MISLLDNTVLSNFTVVRQPQLLQIALNGDLAAPEQAYGELMVGIKTGKLPDVNWQWLDIWSLREEEISVYQRFLQRLNAGEAACLAIALNRDCRVLTDDRDAREVARRLQIPLSGTLGILARLVDTQRLTLDEADNLLAEMIASGYRSPIASLQPIL